MPEKSKDSTIKLFGKTIPLSEKPPKAVVPIANIFADDDNINNCKVDHPSCYTNSLLEENLGKGREYEKDIIADKLMKSEQEVEDLKEDRSKQTDNAPLIASEELDRSKQTDNAPLIANWEAIYGSIPIGNESSGFETCKIDEDRSETSNPEEKTLKLNKVLPCPRCNSWDTKFCYYNNYNVSQPRHFCKHCQRYWTAGGTMRNVPVGAGRRKSKHSSSHCRRLIVSEPLQNARNDETMCYTTQNRFHKPEELNIQVSYRCGENGVEHRSSVSTSNNDVGSQDQTMKNFQSFPPHMPCFPGFFLPCSWNSTRWSSRIPPPTFCPPTFPMSFYPAAPYWSCTIPSTWNVPWLTQPSPSSASNSPLLGKHSRDENLSKPSSNGEDVSIKENDDERCPWIPKTLRIDDLGEVSRSSILVTSGSKNDKSESVGNRRHIKGFQSEVLETSQILQVNPAPAALSR